MRTLSPGRVLWLLSCAIALAMLTLVDTGCRRKAASQQQVVLYVSVDEHIARQIIDRFQQQTGISVHVVGDTEAKKTTGLVERLRSEKANPQADVFWSNEIVQTIALADDGVLDEHLSEVTTDWPRELRDGQRRWFAFAARPRVIVFSPERVPEDQRPATWMDLTHERWKGKVVMADPRFGTTGGHLGAMMAHWDREVMPGYFRAWAEGLAENDVRPLPSGNAGVVEAVAKGEAKVGMTDADDVWAAKQRGQNVDLIYPLHAVAASDGEGAGGDEAGTGTLLTPNTVARIKGGPNPENAKALIDFLLSEEVERLLAESVSHNIPLRPGLAQAYSQYAVPNPLKVDWQRAAGLRVQAIEAFLDAIEDVKADRAAAAEVEADAATAPDHREQSAGDEESADDPQ